MVTEGPEHEKSETAVKIAAFLNRVDFARGPVSVVVQDSQTREVRMMGEMSRDALEQTLHTGQAHFFSRARGRAWKKGETTGGIQWVRQVWINCDNDALVLEVEQVGDVTCHRGSRTCFTHGLMLDMDGSGASPAATTAANAMVPITVGAPFSGRSALLQQPLDSLALETHVRPLLAAYEALLRLDDPGAAVSPFGDLQGADRGTVLPRLLSGLQHLREAVREDAAPQTVLERTASVWSWSALALLLEESADAASMAAAIAQGYFEPRLAPAGAEERLAEVAAALAAHSPQQDLASPMLSLLEVCGLLMRSLGLRPYAFLDHDRRQMLARHPYSEDA